MKYSISVGTVQLVLSFIERYGVAIPSFCAEVGLSAEEIKDPDGRIPTAQMQELWRKAVAATGSKDLALEFGTKVNPYGLGVVSYLLMNCATLRMALEKLCHYQDVACAGVRTHVDIERDLCGLRLEIMDEAIVEPSYAVNSEMTIYLTMIDAMIGTPVLVQEVRLAYARPIDTSAHVRAFRTENVVFDSSQYSLWFPASLLDSQIPHANPSLFPLFEKHLDESLAKVQQSNSLSYRVRQEILRLLKGEEPKLIMVARALGIGERTIQMKLSEEGTGFRELLDDVRKDLAMSHLRENKLSTTDIAFLLGFSEASVFSRTFKKWTGQSPSAYRQAQ